MSEAVNPPEKITRVVDFRIPLPWLLSGAVVLGWGLITMYFQLQTLTEKLAELQIAVKVGNGQSSTVAGEIALLKFRMDALEADAKRGVK